jgi:hypothetical protein
MSKRVSRFDSADREQRFDIMSSPFSSVKTTSQGFLRIPATLTRVGVLEYTRADGSTVRELRPPDEVLKADSLSTLRAAPVTDDHHGLVDPSNIATLSIGVVADDVRNDGRLVRGEVVVNRKDGIEGVNSRRLVEVSPGYSCRIDNSAGEFEGERYDQIQRDIVYNHVALGGEGWGRSGPEVALRLDAAVSIVNDESTTPKQEISKMKKIKIRLDGITYEIEVPEALAATFEEAFAKAETERADAADKIASLEGAKDAADKKATDLEKRLDAATAPAALEKLVADRLAVVKHATELAPELKCDGLSLEEIRLAALKESGFDAERLDGKSAAYIEGAFENASPKATESSEGGPGVSNKPPVKREDAKDERTAEDARLEMEERNRNAWKKNDK